MAGFARCWGFNHKGQIDAPSDLGVVTQVSAGGLHSCALTVDGFVRCWGSSTYGQANPPSDLGVVTQVSAGAYHSCALTVAGLVRCWGRDNFLVTDVPLDLGLVAQVSSGLNYSCALTVDGVVRCWGENNFGKANTPSNLGEVIQVSAGDRHSCALTVDGLVRCWGDNSSGQANVPSDLGEVIQVSAGEINSCALTVAGAVRCWGYNGSGQTDVASDLGGLTQVSAGLLHTCALTVAGAVRCWGYNGSYQTDVPLDLGVVTQVSAGGSSTCALTVTGAVRCWGAGGIAQTSVPLDLGVVTQVSAGGSHACALTVDGVVRCWGDNLYGQAQPPSDLGVVTQVSAGWLHSCALTVAGAVRCWGWNDWGQTYTNIGITDLTQVSAGLYHSCALNVAGAVRCWQTPYWGATNIPSDLGVATQVAVGRYHSCALNVDGVVRCWGLNFAHQTDVPSDLDVVSQISAGENHACALTVDGVARCWGDNGYGQTTVPSAVNANVKIKFKQPTVLAVSAIEGRIAGDVIPGSTVLADFDFVSEGRSHYQWFRSGFAITGASQATYMISQEDLGGSLTVKLLFWGPSNFAVGEASRVVEYPSLVLPEPTISGTNSVGNILTAAVSNSDQQVSISYQWLRNGEDIAGATEHQYSVRLIDLGRSLSVRVSASKDLHSPTTRTSSPSIISTVIPNSPCLGVIDTTLTWLGTSSQPSIVGIPTFGQTVKGVNGSWASGTRYCVFWIADGVPVPKATSATYKLQGSEVGKNVQYVVVGIDKTSKRVGKISEPLLVTKAIFTNTKTPLVKGQARVGNKLTSSVSSWGSGTTYSYQWFRNSTEILGATASSYIPTASDVNATLSLKVCGFKLYFEGRCVESGPQVASLGVISKVGQISILGTSTNVGATLIGGTTQWMPGVELSWQWLADGVDIAGATASSYSIARSDRGKEISLRVTGNAPGYQSVSKLSRGKKIP